jgi:hypothetical protein
LRGKVAKFGRVANSSLAAETIAAVEAAESCVYLQAVMKFVLCDKYTIPIDLLTDNRSLIDNVHTSTPVKNKRLNIEMVILREMCAKKELSSIKWVPDKINVAKPLTKEGASTEYLLRVISGNLKFDHKSLVFQ